MGTDDLSDVLRNTAVALTLDINLAEKLIPTLTLSATVAIIPLYPPP